jgi:hypothetical protein
MERKTKKLKKKKRGNSQRDDNGFTKKEMRFIKAYCISFNATKAAREAGYSEGKRKEKGWEVLQKGYILDEIHRRIAKKEKRMELKSEDVLKQYMRVAFFNPAIMYDENDNFVGIHKLPPQAQTMIKSIKKKKTAFGIETKVELHDAMQAMEKCALHLGMMLPKLKVDVNQKHQMELTLKKDELKELGVEKLLELSNILSQGNRKVIDVPHTNEN